MTLLPCAHCGGEAQLRKYTSGSFQFSVECRDCEIKTLYHETAEAAANVWNRRTAIPQQAVTLRDVFAAAFVSEYLTAVGMPHGESLELAYKDADNLLEIRKPNETETKT